MLRQRVITAIALVAVLLSALFLLSFQHFAWVLGAFFVVGAWEWANFAKLNRWWRALYAIVAIGIMLWSWRWLGFSRAMPFGMENKLKTILAVTAIFWMLAITWIATYPKTARQWANKPVQLIMGVIVLIPAWISLVFLNTEANGQWLIIIAGLTVVFADTGAYFAGRKWGKNKLAATVSPGKTMEGFYGGIGLNVVFAVAVIAYLGRGINDAWFALIVIASSLISVFGDLMESMMKRQRGIKDSGIILPGHGGVLDRIDSITAAAPLFTLVYLFSGWSL